MAEVFAGVAAVADVEASVAAGGEAGAAAGGLATGLAAAMEMTMAKARRDLGSCMLERKGLMGRIHTKSRKNKVAMCPSYSRLVVVGVVAAVVDVVHEELTRVKVNVSRSERR